ncbi:hypothetical protein HIM_05390 [Hirsutella minnesotensis 3608]|uniref:Heme haloperoxidase family profile domain-containing protein n=1 Tax=Hirsutella minnesotensis 3608 TaxID=1043627 RepID=A0A0F7ZKF6_9HYPO|nr:hypothetical protein HIM_05390 [Hirsutella minnesotensis 3608]
MATSGPSLFFFFLFLSSFPKLNLAANSRSACPGLNTLANEGWLPRSGKFVTAQAVTTACFEGLGVSPEICAFLILTGLRAANLPDLTVFSLHDVDRGTWKIQHTRSLSRDDIESPPFPKAPPESTSLFQQRPWNVTLQAMEQCKKGPRELIDANCFGRARAARVRDKGLVYDELAATHGAVEAARIMLALGDKNGAQLNYIRFLFEKERFPTKLGWRRRPFSGGINDMFEIAIQSQQADIILRCPRGGRIATRWDLLDRFATDKKILLKLAFRVKTLLRASGYTNKTLFDTIDAIDAEHRRGAPKQQDFGKFECNRN